MIPGRGIPSGPGPPPWHVSIAPSSRPAAPAACWTSTLALGDSGSSVGLRAEPGGRGGVHPGVCGTVSALPGGDRGRERGAAAPHPGQLHVDPAASRSRGRVPEVQHNHFSRPRVGRTLA